MLISELAERIFLDAVELPEAERERYLHRACSGDKQLLKEVMTLLDAAQNADPWFDAMAGQFGLPSLADDAEPPVKQIGPWNLVRLIGRGGMGAVYLVERSDGQYEQQAALKLLPMGLGNSAARQAFLAERQILARLSHRNIARLLDGGVTTDGTPYFVMDYVEGLPIDDYCDQQRLDVRARLELVLDVCEAVDYAHRNMVIHRDLKPGNVLVDVDGQVRLLDFGIAKLQDLDEGTAEVTQLARRPMTPGYASPEMLDGEPVDVAADVYSLGAMTYRLLTGHLPFDVRDLPISRLGERLRSEDPRPASRTATSSDEADRIAASRQSRPARLAATLRGDIDLILATALANDRDQRYASVDRFAADLRRHLDGLPIAARPPSMQYRLGKFVRRHQGGVAVALLTLTALVASTVITAWQMVEAKRQRDIAVQQQQRIQASNEFYGLLMEEIGDERLTSVELLDRGRTLLERQYGTNDAFIGPLLYEVSRRYSVLGERDTQLELLLQSEELAREYGDRDLLAAVLCQLRSAYRVRDPERAATYASEGERVYSTLRTPSVDAIHACLRMRARDADQQGDVDNALAHLFEARALLDANPSTATHLKGTLLNDIAHMYYRTGRPDESVRYLDETLTLLDSTGRGSTVGYLRVASNKAVVLQNLGRFPEARSAFEDLVARLRASDYQQRGAGSLLDAYGSLLAAVGDMQAAEAAHREGLEASLRAGDEANAASNYLGLSRVQLADQSFDEALASVDSAAALLEGSELVERTLSRTTRVLRAKILRSMGRTDEALVAINSLLTELGYPEVGPEEAILSAIIEAAAVHQALDNLGEAEALTTDLIRRLRARSPDGAAESVHVGRAFVHRAEIRIEAGDKAPALDDLQTALPILERTLGEDHKETIAARELLETGELP